MKRPIRIAVTGAAGQIAYSLLFRIAAGDMLGGDQPIILQLLDITQSQESLKGIVMELNDCAFPLLNNVLITDDPKIVFHDANIAILVGARPRSKDMERKDLLMANAEIFIAHGEALNEVADRNIKILIVGNPANTNALITMKNAPDLNSNNFSAMMRLDHNRSLSQIAGKINKPLSSIRKMTVWGNHSATQYPDLSCVEVDGQNIFTFVNDRAWIENYFIPTIQERGTEIIRVRGLSSAASAANAVMNHMHDWIYGTKENDWVSMSIPSDGSYDIPEGVIYSYPVICQNGAYKIVKGLDLGDFGKIRIQNSYQELAEERDSIRRLLR